MHRTFIGAQRMKGFIRDGEDRHVCRGASFGIFIKSEGYAEGSAEWHYGIACGSVHYMLEIDVDDRSGEDGALAPAVDFMPVQYAYEGKHPPLAALFTSVIACEDEWWEAWYGNDAPDLTGNRVTFSGVQGDKVKLRWEAEYDAPDGGASGSRAAVPFSYEGEAEFKGISLQVLTPEDADPFLMALWGAEPLEALEKHDLGVTDYGEAMPASRRRWHNYLYWPKFMGEIPSHLIKPN